MHIHLFKIRLFLHPNSFWMDITQDTLPFLGRTMKMLDNYIEDLFSEAGVPLSKLQFITLKIIDHHQELAQNNLAVLCGKDKTTLTRNINTLERKQLVARTVSNTDKRIKLVTITPQGKALLNQAMPVIKKVANELDQSINAQEREQLKGILSKIRAQIPSKYSID